MTVIKFQIIMDMLMVTLIRKTYLVRSLKYYNCDVLHKNTFLFVKNIYDITKSCKEC